MTNRKIIELAVAREGLEIGCYDESINNLTKKEVAKISQAVTGDATDICVLYRNKKHIIEIGIVDREIDFYMMKFETYIELYGEEYADKF